MSTINETIQLEAKTCGKCAGTFALNAEFLKYSYANKGGYNCPYCDTRWSWGESDADRLRKQLETRERELREAKCEALRQKQLLDSEKARLAKTERKLKRIGKGVCPCCNRTFQNIARHMATKHPNEVHPK